MNISDYNIIKERFRTINFIQNLSKDISFKNKSILIENELKKNIKKYGENFLIVNLYTCGDIPENFGHDTTEEKIYSKYTDCILSETFKFLNISSSVLDERSDAADVEGKFLESEKTFVADAKAFRLTRTAKNQKDFKVNSMNKWKYGRNYALLVCPIYQLPNIKSQIYDQAVKTNVLIFTYTHLIMLLKYSKILKKNKAKIENFFIKIFESNKNNKSIEIDAKNYWAKINNCFKSFSQETKKIFFDEKIKINENIEIQKKISLKVIQKQIKKIRLLTLDEAIEKIIKMKKFDNNFNTINTVKDKKILDL